MMRAHVAAVVETRRPFIVQAEELVYPSSPTTPLVPRHPLAFGRGLAMARIRRDGETMTAILGTPESVPMLEEIVEAHRRVRHEAVPAVVAAGFDGPTPHVLLGITPVCTMADLVRWLEERGELIDHGPWAGIVRTGLEVLQATHAAGFATGVCSLSNLVLDPEGRVHFIAPGTQVLLTGQSEGRRDRVCAVAPDVACGAPPTVGADVQAAMLLVHRTMHVMRPAESVGELVLGEAEESAWYAASVSWFHTRVLGALRRRASATEALEHLADRWRRIRVTPAMDAPCAEVISAYLEARTSRRRLPSGVTPIGIDLIRVRVDGRSIEANGERTDLTRRASLRRILATLAEARVASPGEPVSRDTLQDTGWPGDRLIGHSGRARVHVAVSTLRRLGLKDVLVHDGDGYFLDPRAPVVVVR